MVDRLSQLAPEHPDYRHPNDCRPVEGVKDWRHYLAIRQPEGREATRLKRLQEAEAHQRAYDYELDNLPTKLPESANLFEVLRWKQKCIDKYFRAKTDEERAKIKSDYGLKFATFPIKND